MKLKEMKEFVFSPHSEITGTTEGIPNIPVSMRVDVGRPVSEHAVGGLIRHIRERTDWGKLQKKLGVQIVPHGIDDKGALIVLAGTVAALGGACLAVGIFRDRARRSGEKRDKEKESELKAKKRELERRKKARKETVEEHVIFPS